MCGGRGSEPKRTEANRSEPQEFLKEALDIFDGAGLNGLRCDTLNSMGTLKQSRGRLRRGASPRNPNPHPGGGQRRIDLLGSSDGPRARLRAWARSLRRAAAPGDACRFAPAPASRRGGSTWIHLDPPGSTWIHLDPQYPYALST